MTRRAVFLDRDGVINRAFVRDGHPYPPTSPDEVEILPGVREALERLGAAGFKLIVATNQPDIARGTVDADTVAAIDALLMRELPLDRIYVCPHDSADGCACRKPKPGMLLRAAVEFGISLEASFMVGDRWRDVAAGNAAGCKTFFISYDYAEQRPERPDHTVRSLAEAADVILANYIAVTRT